MGSTRFRNPWALSSALAALGTLQPKALGFLNRVDPLVSPIYNLASVSLRVSIMRAGVTIRPTRFKYYTAVLWYSSQVLLYYAYV